MILLGAPGSGESSKYSLPCHAHRLRSPFGGAVLDLAHLNCMFAEPAEGVQRQVLLEEVRRKNRARREGLYLHCACSSEQYPPRSARIVFGTGGGRREISFRLGRGA